MSSLNPLIAWALIMLGLVGLAGLLWLILRPRPHRCAPPMPRWRGCLRNTECAGRGYWCALPRGHQGPCAMYAERVQLPTNAQDYFNARDAHRRAQW
jgi:hypothetical protein